MLTHVFLSQSQSGGEGGRGGGDYQSYKTSYCSDNARDQLYGGQFCEYGGGYTGCCNEGGRPGDAYDNYDHVSLLTFLPGSGGGAGADINPLTGNGGAGGYGGAAILLYSTEMILNGVVKANGGDGGPSSYEP